jgi:hypothetical protein
MSLEAEAIDELEVTESPTPLNIITAAESARPNSRRLFCNANIVTTSMLSPSVMVSVRGDVLVAAQDVSPRFVGRISSISDWRVIPWQRAASEPPTSQQF